MGRHLELERFRRELVSGLDEPVRRYLIHAIGEGVPVGLGTHLRMSGRIRVGVWLPFTATERCDARSFEWRARVGWGRAQLLQVRDSYTGGGGRTSAHILGRMKLFEQIGDNTARSAAGRAALEAAVWAPASLVGSRDVDWWAEGDEVIVACWPVPPERPEVRLGIDERGAVRSAVAERWGTAGQSAFAYVPCGCEVHAERRFAGLTVPSRVTVGWWFGTLRYAPFFRAEVSDLSPAS